MGAAAICADDPVPSVSDLADQVLEVLNYFRLGAVMCMGVMAGAYILTLFAMKFRERVLGLILVSPLCKAPSWTEWLCNKVMSNLLYYYGMCSLLKDCLLYRYFSKEVCGSAEVPESDIVQACRKLLDDRQSTNVLRFLQAINRRPDITDEKLVTINNHGSDAVLHVQCVYMDVLYINACKRFKHCPIMEQCYYTGSSLQVSGHGGAAIRNVSAHGIFSPGVWYTQKKSLKDSANLVQIPSNQCLKKTSILRMWRLMRFVRNEQIVFLNTYKTGTMWIDDRILGTSAYVRHM